MKTIAKLKKKVNKEDKFIISEESAIDQLALLINYYELDLSEDDEEGQDEILFNNLVESIRKGRIEIKQNGENIPVLTQIIKNGQRLDYVNNIANARANIDFKDQKHFKNSYQFAGALCGVGEDGIRGLDRADSRVAEYVSAFFLKL